MVARSIICRLKRNDWHIFVKRWVNGLKNKNNSDIFISTTGIAGPDGGSEKKPVGTVFHSFYFKQKKILTIKNFYEGNRYKIRLKASMFSINETFKKLRSIM